jgi:predicted transcriptional regulator
MFKRKKKKRIETFIAPKEPLIQKEKVESVKEKPTNPTNGEIQKQKKLLPLPYSLEEMKSKYFQNVKIDVEKDLKLNSNVHHKMYQRIHEYRTIRELKENEKIIIEMKQFLKEKLKSNPLTQKELERRSYWEEINNN